MPNWRDREQMSLRAGQEVMSGTDRESERENKREGIKRRTLLLSSTSKPAPVIALVLTLSWFAQPVAAFTDKDTREIFGMLDPEHHGKVTLVDFQINKVQAFFWRSRDERGDIKPLTFKDTILSREFFDKADFGHKGYLDGLDIVYAIRFDDIDTKRRGYFEHADLVTYLHKIGR
jgi:hypothetical protein